MLKFLFYLFCGVFCSCLFLNCYRILNKKPKSTETILYSGIRENCVQPPEFYGDTIVSKRIDCNWIVYPTNVEKARCTYVYHFTDSSNTILYCYAFMIQEDCNDPFFLENISCDPLGGSYFE